MNCSAPDLGLFLVSALFRLFSLTTLCELNQRPLILQSICVNCNAPDLGFFFLLSFASPYFTYSLHVSSINAFTGQSIGVN